MKILLRNRNLALTVLGRFVSNFGTYIQSFVLSLYVLNTTGSATLFASVLAIAYIPRLLIGPFAGVIVDRFDKKKIIVGLDILSGVVMMLFASYYIVQGQLPIWLIIIVELIMALINIFFSPAMGTVIPTVVEKEDLADANSANAFLDSISNIGAPVVAGLLYGVFGMLVILIINSMSFFISALSEVFIQLPAMKKKSPLNFKSFTADFKEGFRFIIKTREILAFITFGFIVNFALSPLFGVSIPYILKNILLVNDIQFGLLNTLLALGMLIGPLFAPLVIKKVGYNKATYIGFSLSALIVAGMSLTLWSQLMSRYVTLWVPIALIILAGVIVISIVMLINIALQTEIQSIVPVEILGRVSAVAGTFMILAAPLGQMVFGALYDIMTSSSILLLTAIGLFVSALAYYWMVKPPKASLDNEHAEEVME
ncbi:MFS transporter [Vallitalea okinawensis]|uniref:MFS transporter n=1 Tax=Vallitalea okinawensis TaxID=2078660 RepID=UPI000CFD6A0F|nr:MFS transporter [Vallitalea okinawensis]